MTGPCIYNHCNVLANLGARRLACFYNGYNVLASHYHHVRPSQGTSNKQSQQEKPDPFNNRTICLMNMTQKVVKSGKIQARLSSDGLRPINLSFFNKDCFHVSILLTNVYILQKVKEIMTNNLKGRKITYYIRQLSCYYEKP